MKNIIKHIYNRQKNWINIKEIQRKKRTGLMSVRNAGDIQSKTTFKQREELDKH